MFISIGENSPHWLYECLKYIFVPFSDIYFYFMWSWNVTANENGKPGEECVLPSVFLTLRYFACACTFFDIKVRTYIAAFITALCHTVECFCWPWQKSRDILDVSTIVFSGIKVLCLYERAQCCISLHAGKKHLLRTLYYWLRCTYVRPYVCAWGRIFHFDQTHFIFWQNISPHSFKRESSVEAI